MNEIESNARNQQSIIELKDNSRRSKNLITSFWILFAVTAIGVITGYNEITILKKVNQGIDISVEQAELSDIMQGFVGLFITIAFFTTGVLFIFWFRRAYYNVHQFKFLHLKYSESMAVWGWIIPILSLVIPIRIMTEIWNGTQKGIKHYETSFEVKSPQGLIGLWWTFYLISSILSQIVFRTSLNAETTQQMLQASQAFFYSSLFDLPAILIIINLVKKIVPFESKLAQEVIMHDGLIDE